MNAAIFVLANLIKGYTFGNGTLPCTVKSTEQRQPNPRLVTYRLSIYRRRCDGCQLGDANYERRLSAYDNGTPLLLCRRCAPHAQDFARCGDVVLRWQHDGQPNALFGDIR